MAAASLKTTSIASGQAGENAALNYLTQQGLTLVERNFRCRHGEIDLIMRDQSILVFVEVRKRKQCAIRRRGCQHYLCQAGSPRQGRPDLFTETPPSACLPL